MIDDSKSSSSSKRPRSESSSGGLEQFDWASQVAVRTRVVEVKVRGEKRYCEQNGDLQYDVKGAGEVLSFLRDPLCEGGSECIRLVLGKPGRPTARQAAVVAREHALQLAGMLDSGAVTVTKVEVLTRGGSRGFIVNATLRGPENLIETFDEKAEYVPAAPIEPVAPSIPQNQNEFWNDEANFVSQPAPQPVSYGGGSSEGELPVLQSFAASQPTAATAATDCTTAPPSKFVKALEFRSPFEAERPPTTNLVILQGRELMKNCIGAAPDNQRNSQPLDLRDRLDDGWLSRHGYPGIDEDSRWAELGLNSPRSWAVYSANRMKQDWRNDSGCTMRSTQSMQSLEDKYAAREARIDESVGKIGKIGNSPWSTQTLSQVDDTIRSQMWSKHGGSITKQDQLIACFGPGGYVLGQTEHELKLVVPQESTELIKTLCTANSIMYHIVFGEPAPAPGFNTIIFALHWRGSGFGYHSDQKSSLITKDFCMVPRQGVMTTVLYEKPAADSGKETLCFIPTEIGTSTRWSESYKNPYRCLLSLPTEHGMVHAQKSGLQEIAKHGVFPTVPDSMGQFQDRQGCRVAITSRICPDGPGIQVTMNKLRADKKFKAVIDPVEGLYTVNWRGSERTYSTMKSARAEMHHAFMGQEEPLEENCITALEFDRSGDLLAAGTKSGMVVLYKRNVVEIDTPLPPGAGSVTPPASPSVTSRKSRSPGKLADSLNRTRDSPRGDSPRDRVVSKQLDDLPRSTSFWSVYYEFRSHSPQFDCLKSVELEPKINSIRWCHPVGTGSACFLAANDKVVKLWKISQREHSFIPNCISSYEAGKTAGHLALPYKTARLPDESATRTSNRKTYKEAHQYHINSIDVCSDRETFLSADDLRINLWRLERDDITLSYVDIKPDNMEDLTEVITTASFHSTHSHLLAYATSKGTIKLVDSRQRALGDRPVRVLDEPEAEETRGLFSEIVASVSGLCFDPSDTHKLFSRDYMSCRLWDLRMESHAVRTIHVHEHLRPFLNDLYEADAICDRFQVSCSPDGKRFVTGSYNNQFVVKNVEGHTVSLGQLPTETQQHLPNDHHHSFAPQMYPIRRALGSLAVREAEVRSQEQPSINPRLTASGEFADMLRRNEASDPEEHAGTPVKPCFIARGTGHGDIRADQKAMLVSWSPREALGHDNFAVASSTGVYIYRI